MDGLHTEGISTAIQKSGTIGELHDKATEVNEVAYELLEDIENEWLRKHKPKHANSLWKCISYELRREMIAEEVVLHDVVNCFH